MKNFLQVRHIYILPADGFHRNNKLQDFELICNNDVVPIDMVEIKNPLEYLSSSPFVQLKFL